VMPNAVPVSPAGIVTEAGIVTNVPVCVSVTTTPFDPALPSSQTFPVAEPVPAMKDPGVIERLFTDGRDTVNDAVAFTL